jgi:Ser/Thr protein kinase RdoA (MazF antagonist)
VTIFDYFARPALARPAIDEADARRVAGERYGVSGEVVELGSNQDRNFRIAAAACC